MKKGVKKGSAQARSFAERQNDDKTFWTIKVIAYTQQEIMDAVSLTLNDEFGFGEDRLKRFRDAFDSKYDEIHKLGDDEYTVATVERALQAAWGRYYQPREERYDFRLRVGNKEVKL